MNKEASPIHFFPTDLQQGTRELYFLCCGKLRGGTIEDAGNFNFVCANCKREYFGRVINNRK